MSEGSNAKETVAILGGTGDLGTGLAIRWSKAGHKIVIGSRTLEKAQAAVTALHEISPETPAEAMENLMPLKPAILLCSRYQPNTRSPP